MLRTISAIYENGVLRPSERLPLAENQRVNVTIEDMPAGPADAWLDHDYMASIDAAREAEPSIEEVRQALAKIPGNLSSDIRAERDARG